MKKGFGNSSINKEIIDNFLSQEDFHNIQTTLFHERFTWSYVEKSEISGERAQLVHMFWEPIEGHISSHSQILIPFISKIRPGALLRIKANLRPQTTKVVEDPLHVDVGCKSTTAILYMNTCDGYTHFEDGTKVKSIANRLVIFPSQTYHGGTSCSDETKRVVINFNYIDGKDFYTNDLNRLYK
tara:strand:+ start:277 stop:828 length:552 start_codon:yes stop_codon:yes gene_type:complete